MLAGSGAALLLSALGIWIYRGRITPPQQITAAPAVTSQTNIPATSPKVQANPKPESGSADTSGDRLFWTSINSSNDPRVFHEYLSRYPNGEFASLAKMKLKPRSVSEQPAPSGPRPGETRRNPRDGLQYVWIPPGSFQMGCSPGDTECGAEELPRHPVRLSHGFWLGQTEVTVEAWSHYAHAGSREMPPEPMEDSFALNPGWAERNFPICNLDWNDAHSYCTWAGGRLPTEAEWEYAARAGSTQARYGPPDEIAWYANNSGKQYVDFSALRVDDKVIQERRIKNENRMHPVATKRPNALGLYDMLGNVNEWINDWVYYFPGAGNLDPYYKESPEVDPTGPDNSPNGPNSPHFRTFRGAAYPHDARGVRVSSRGARFGANGRAVRTGCRCALDQIPGGSK